MAPSDSDITSCTGLHPAAHEGRAAEIKRLISTGADVNARDHAGRTPAHVVAFASHDAAITALANGGADMNALESGVYDVLTIAVVADDPEMVFLAITLGNNADLTTSVYGRTALIAAAHLGHYDVVSRLAAAGASLDHINNLRRTALIEFVILGDSGPNHIKTVQILVDAGADKSIPDRDGNTPLKHAMGVGT